jgi:hypothetical protein
MRFMLVGSCASFLLLLGCGVDATAAAGAAAGAAGLDKAPREVVSPSHAAKKTADQQPKTRPRVDTPRFDGVEGESQDKDHKGHDIAVESTDQNPPTGATIAAPFVPGGAVISAGVSKTDSTPTSDEAGTLAH